MNNLLVIIFIAININLFVQDANGQQCTAGGMRKLDGQVAKIITIGNSGRKFPESRDQEFKVYCNENKDYIKEIEKFNKKCLENLPKQVASVLIYTVKSTINQLCSGKSRKLDDLMNSTKCINTATPEINRCYTKLLDNILGIANADDNKKIPFVCCEYYRLFPCMRTRIKRVSICTDNHIETSIDFVRSMLGNVIDLLCGDYTEGSDKCEKLERPPKKLKTQRRTKSFVIPLIQMFESFEEA